MYQPAVITSEFPHYHWIYWIGPILGALLAAAFYRLVKVLEFDLVNPDIDAPVPKKLHTEVTEATGTNGLGHDHGTHGEVA